MPLIQPDIPSRWLPAYRNYRKSLEEQYALIGAWLILAGVLAYQLSYSIREVAAPAVWSAEALLRIPVYASVLVTLISHYRGWPAWRPKTLIRLMCVSLMTMILLLFLIYYTHKPSNLDQASGGLLISLFGTTLLATRGLWDWAIQTVVPLAVFIASALLLQIPLLDLVPYLFGPAVMLTIGFITSETLRNLSINEFLAKQSLREMATTDQLTGLMNRHAFLPLLHHEMQRCRRDHGHPSSLILADLDHFKRVNDQYGHESGDQVLQETANRLRKSLRKQDVICRWGGEEFLILLPDTAAEGALAVAGKIRMALSDAPVDTARGLIRQTISLGVAVFDGDPSPEALTDRADRALYQAKNNGRNRAVLAPGRKVEAGPDGRSLRPERKGAP